MGAWPASPGLPRSTPPVLFPSGHASQPSPILDYRPDSFPSRYRKAPKCLLYLNGRRSWRAWDGWRTSVMRLSISSTVSVDGMFICNANTPVAQHLGCPCVSGASARLVSCRSSPGA